MPVSARRLLPHFEVQEAKALAAVSQVSQYEQFPHRPVGIVLRHPLFRSPKDSGVLERKGEQVTQPLRMPGVHNGEELLVESNLIYGPA